ncbi:MAG TPA: MBL fold metallo-hydrolase [Candidatus Acidoferrum sp.]|nr:MBL fold metallo-hydrolase [Candidatus Acidoferrum sp.]
MLNRRDFLQLSTLAGGVALLPGAVQQAVAAAPAALKVQMLQPNLALITGGACNVLVSKSANGELLVVDGGLKEGGKELRRTIEGALDSKKFATLINTHWHPEQTGLNELLGNRNTRIFAHENTREWLGTSVKRLLEDKTIAPLPESGRPNDVFYNYGEFKHGATNVQYGYLRQAHTDGDMYVYFPEANVLHAGGVIANDGWPFLDWWTGGWMGGVVDGIETLLSVANDGTLIIPATGKPMTKAELLKQREMQSKIFTTVRNMFQKANTVEQTVAAKPAKDWEAQYGSADAFVTLAWWSLIPHLTPDA